VVISFCMIEGLDGALANYAAGLNEVQACFCALANAVRARGASIRQFIKDDKGVVCIWALGLPNNSFEDNAERGLLAATDAVRAMRSQGLRARVGITSGTAFCGLVGAAYRCEYSVMGPSVNLAARLMCACEKLRLDVLCNDALHEMAMGRASCAFVFEHVGLQTVKGYNAPVAFYSPLLQEAGVPTTPRSTWEKLKPLVRDKAIFSLNELETAWQQVNARQLEGSIRDATLAHLGRLPFEQKLLVKMASCLGCEFDFSLLASIYSGPQRKLHAALEADGVRRFLSRSAERLRFNEEMERTIIYSLLLISQRQRIHHLAADSYRRMFVALQRSGSALATSDIPDLLAYHAELAGELSLAGACYTISGLAAERQGKFGRAARRYQACVRIFEKHNPQSMDLTFLRAQALLTEQYERGNARAPRGFSATRTYETILSQLELKLNGGNAPSGVVRWRRVHATMRVAARATDVQTNSSHRTSITDAATEGGGTRRTSRDESGMEVLATQAEAAQVRYRLAFSMMRESLQLAADASAIEGHLQLALRVHETLNRTDLQAETHAALGILHVKLSREASAAEGARHVERALSELRQSILLRPGSSALLYLIELHRHVAAGPHHDLLRTLSLCGVAQQLTAAHHGPFMRLAGSIAQMQAEAYKAIGEHGKAISCAQRSVRVSANGFRFDRSADSLHAFVVEEPSEKAKARFPQVQPRRINSESPSPCNPALRRTAYSHGAMVTPPGSANSLDDASLDRQLSGADELDVELPWRSHASCSGEGGEHPADEWRGMDGGKPEEGVAFVLLRSITRMRSRSRPPRAHEAAGSFCEHAIASARHWSDAEIEGGLISTFGELAEHFWVGLVLEDDGALSDNVEELRTRTLSAMRLCVRFASYTEKKAASHALAPLITFAHGVARDPQSLHLVLLMVLLSSLSRVALLVSDMGADISELEAPSPASLLQFNANVRLPSIMTLNADSRDELIDMLACVRAFNFSSFCLGELVVGSLAPLRKLGNPAARRVLLFGVSSFLSDIMLSQAMELTKLLSSELARSVQASVVCLTDFLASSPAQSEVEVFRRFYAMVLGDAASTSPRDRLNIMLLLGGAQGHAPLSSRASRASLLNEALGQLPPLRLHALEAELSTQGSSRPIVAAGASELLLEYYSIGMQAGSSPVDAIVPALSALESLFRAARGHSSGGGSAERDRTKSVQARHSIDRDEALPPLHCVCVNATRAIRATFEAICAAVPDVDPAEAARLAMDGARDDTEQEAVLDDTRYAVMHRTDEMAYLVTNSIHHRANEKIALPGEKNETSLRARLAHAAESFAGGQPTPLIIFTDPGRDADDELMLVLASAVEALGLFNLKLVCTTRPPAVRRARLAKGVLEAVGLDRVPAIAMNNSSSPASSTSSVRAEFASSEPDTANSAEATMKLLRTYEEAQNSSLTLLILSNMTAAAAFIEQNEKIFQAKTANVCILGGVNDESLFDEEAPYLLPDLKATNHKADPAAAAFIFSRCQKLQVSMVVLSSSATDVVCVPSFFYDELAALGHPVAVHLRESLHSSISSLWEKACMRLDERRDVTFELESSFCVPADEQYDRNWFANTFLGGTAMVDSLETSGGIWQHVVSLPMARPLALLTAHHGALSHFFDVEAKLVSGVEHLVVGVGVGGSEESSGVREAHQLRAFLMDAVRYSLLSSREQAVNSSFAFVRSAESSDALSSPE